jgi:2Fe-2S ferredoxin
MPQLTIATPAGESRTIEVESDRTVMDIIREQGNAGLLAICGGCLSCATCHVYVDAAFADKLPPISEDEDALLDGSDHRNASSRLSCQIRMSDVLSGLRVTIAPEG